MPTSKTPHPHAHAQPTRGVRATPNNNARPITLFTAPKLVFRLFICVTTDIETIVFFIFILEFKVARNRNARPSVYRVKTMPARQHTTSNDTTTVLGAARARWGRRRLLGERLNKLAADRHKLKTCGCNQQQQLRRKRKFELRQWLGKFHALLGPLRTGDDFAKGAWMLAVKRSRDSVGKGRAAEVFGEHPGPRHGLQRTPVCAGPRQQHEDQ